MPQAVQTDDDEDFEFIPLSASQLTGHFAHEAYALFNLHSHHSFLHVNTSPLPTGSLVCICEAECMGPLDRTTLVLIGSQGNPKYEREGLFFRAATLATGQPLVQSELRKNEHDGRNQMLDALCEIVPQFGDQIAVRRSPLEVEDVLALQSWDYAREAGILSTRPLRTWFIKGNADIKLKS